MVCKERTELQIDDHRKHTPRVTSTSIVDQTPAPGLLKQLVIIQSIFDTRTPIGAYRQEPLPHYRCAALLLGGCTLEGWELVGRI